MKRVVVEIMAKVKATVTVPDYTTDAEIEGGVVDIFFYPIDNGNNYPWQQKEDLGADEYSVKVVKPVEVDPNQTKLEF